jgi:YVTN family beta-propeller protein
VGEVPEGISMEDKTGNIYIANWGSNQVSVIDSQTLKILTQIKTGDKSRAFGKFILESPSNKTILN